VEFESLALVFCSSLLAILIFIPFIVRSMEKRGDIPWGGHQHVMIIRRNRTGWPHYNNALPPRSYFPPGPYFDKWVLLTCEDGSEGKVNAELIGTFPTKRDAIKASMEKIDEFFMGMRLLLAEYLGDDTYVDTLSEGELIIEYKDHYRYGLSQYIHEKIRERESSGEEDELSDDSDSESVSSQETVDDSVDEAEEDDNSDDADYGSMKVAQLKELLKEKGMPASGKKADMISRLSD